MVDQETHRQKEPKTYNHDDMIVLIPHCVCGRFQDRKCYSNRSVIGSSLFRCCCNVIVIIDQDFFEFLHHYRDTMNLRNVYS